ncbi:MAG: hypothetical protein HOO67_00930 [Candidatus Peribacteraceae bacterium]|nr:hypothetical protein [Candidatus Peribacteraceae bacterium]
MHAISLWFLTYALPAFVTGGIIQFFSRYKSNPKRDGMIIHAGLLLSILASQYALYLNGSVFPWSPHILSFLFFIASVLFASRMLGMFGVWYALSAFLQQLTILSSSFLLLTFLSLPIVVLLIVPIFALGHAQDVRHRCIRIIVISLWGAASISLFSIMHDLYFLAALHTMLGVIGIQRKIMYPQK